MMDAGGSRAVGNPPPKRRRIVRKIKGNEGEGTESSGGEEESAGAAGNISAGKKHVPDQGSSPVMSMM